MEQKRPSKKRPKRNTIGQTVFITLTGIFLLLVSFIGFSARWGLTTWGDLDIDEIIFQLQAPLTGTGNGMIADYVIKGIVPTIVVMILYLLILRLLKKRASRMRFAALCLAAALIAAFVTKNYVWDRLKVDEWLSDQSNESLFIEENYADPQTTKLTFPEKKRNLVHIYLESMETTFTDTESGGAFPSDIIPELTEIAVSGEDFSGSDPALNGGIVYPGSTNTMSAIFTHSSGLPLKVDIGNNQMDTQDTFFPKVTAIGDILEEEGYNQVFLLGSDAVFGGRNVFFKDHGNFEIRDYIYAKEQGWIPSDYKVFWGYEDEKLFEFAKETLAELAAQDKPFNLTILTVDSHFEDGYVCRLCRDDFGDDQYANVFACSSRQTAAFLQWLSEQDYYQDTAVVLTGDHTTMDKDFCTNVDKAYQRRTYTAFINSAVEPADPDLTRVYSTQDTFPTTLAAMGVQIEGDRLALGTNLFSSRQTLSEEFGKDTVRNEISRRSEFLHDLEQIDMNSEALMERIKAQMAKNIKFTSYDQETGIASLKVLAPDFSMAVSRMTAVYEEKESGYKEMVQLSLEEGTQRSYIGTIDLSGRQIEDGEISISIYLEDGGEYKDIASASVSDLISSMESEESE